VKFAQNIYKLSNEMFLICLGQHLNVVFIRDFVLSERPLKIKYLDDLSLGIK
jgi:hypothetical protein